MIVVDRREVVNEFFLDRTGVRMSTDFRGALYVPDEYQHRDARMDDVAVAVGYDNFVGRCCCVHVVVQRPEMVSRRMVREAFTFPFMTHDREAVLALIEASRDELMDQAQRLGFRLVHTVPAGGRIGDLAVMQLLRPECRWLRRH